LIEAGADRESIRDATRAAAEGGNVEALRVLLEKIPDVAVTRDDDGHTLLIDAAKGGSIDVVRLVLERGAPVNEKGPGGLTPLHVAAESGHDAIVRVLLDLGAEVNARDDAGMEPLHKAADESRDGVVRLLLDSGADVNTQCECPDDYGGGATPLMEATEDADIEVVRILLDRAADANIASKEGWTALMLALSRCEIGADMDLVQLLLEKGADVNAQLGGVRITPLMQAQSVPCLGIARVLLEKGADANAKDKNDWTALTYALRSGSVEGVQALLERGARLDDRTSDGMTPLEWAESNLTGELKSEMTQVLRSAGAK
jgi:ankyrin repeat protein